MPFLSFYESFVRPKSSSCAKIKSSYGKIKTASSCTDIRAFSANPLLRRQYFMETFDDPSDDEDQSKEKVTEKRSKSPDLKNNSFQSQLVVADCKIAKLTSLNKILKEKNTECSKEVENLKALVKNLEEKTANLDNLKEQRDCLNSQNKKNVKRHLLKAEQEICLLKCELKIFEGIKEKYDELRKNHVQLKSEHDVLSRTLGMFKEEKAQLNIECESHKENLNLWKTKARSMLSVVTDKKALKDKMKQKDEKISKLCESITTQEICIQDLNNQLTKVANDFELKKKILTNKTEELQSELDQKTSSVIDLESQVAMSKVVVQELESLNEQFRVTNTDLSQTVALYKTQFFNVLESVNQMVEMIENLQKEVEEKNKEIEEMKTFPHTSKANFYFEELNRFLNQEEVLCETMKSIKSIVECLKRDFWVPLKNSIELYDSSSQTFIPTQDTSTQKFIQLFSTQVQTSDSSESYTEVLKQIDLLSSENTSLVSFCQSQKDLSDTLQQAISDKITQINEKEETLNKLESQNENFIQKMAILNENIVLKDTLLEKSIEQIDLDSKFQNLIQNQFETILSSTFIEYQTYICVLESCLNQKERKIDLILKFMNKSENDKLKQEIFVMTLKLGEEKSKNVVLNDQIVRLKKENENKSDRISEVENKLSFFDSTIDNFAKENEIFFPNEGDKLTTIFDSYKKLVNGEIEVQKMTVKECWTKKEVYKYLKMKDVTKVKTQMKLMQLSGENRRMKSIMKRFEDKIDISQSLIEEMQKISELLNYENDNLKRNNLSLIEEIGLLKLELKNLKLNLVEVETSKNELSETRENMEKLISGLMKKLSKYKNQMEKNDENENSDLKAENVSLFLELKALKGKKSRDVGVQNNIDNGILENIKTHYEGIIQALRKQHNIEKDHSQKQYGINLKMLHETYEREKISIKRVQAEKILKLQSLHEEEVTALKEEMKTSDERYEKQIESLRNQNQAEIDELRNNYDAQLAQKESLFTAENEMLKIRLVKTVMEKDTKLDRVVSDMALNLQNFKNKCKINVQKLKEKHKTDLDRLVEMCKKEVIKVMEADGKKGKKGREINLPFYKDRLGLENFKRFS